jgi:hypothetical protein
LAKQYRLQMVLKMGRVALAKAAAKGKRTQRARTNDRLQLLACWWYNAPTLSARRQHMVLGDRRHKGRIQSKHLLYRDILIWHG